MKWLLSFLILVVSFPMLGSAADDPKRPSSGKLQAWPGEITTPTGRAGLRQLGSGPRAAWLYVPSSYSPSAKMSVVLVLHGAGGSGQRSIETIKPYAERMGFIALAPSSHEATWDVIASRRFGPDVAAVDSLLKHVFSAYAVDPGRVAIAGFSDGATYSLSLGLTNGKLFRHVIAFSPGFTAAGRAEGRPRIFVSHGALDRVLPIDICSRRIVPSLKHRGYTVDYHEFRGGHTVPQEIATGAYERLVAI